MPSTPHLRPMTVADLPAARHLWSEAEGVELAEGDSVEELTRYLRRNPGASFVAHVGEQLVGAVLAGYDGRRGFLYHLAAARGQQRAGLGRALVESAVAALKSAGVVRVLILISRENGPGKSFWTKQGWESLMFAEPMGLDL